MENVYIVVFNDVYEESSVFFTKEEAEKCISETFDENGDEYIMTLITARVISKAIAKATHTIEYSPIEDEPEPFAELEE